MKNNMLLIAILIVSLLVPLSAWGQPKVLAETNIAILNQLSESYHTQYLEERTIAEAWAKERNLPVRMTLPDGTIYELQKIINGRPLYYKTTNLNAARTVSTDDVWSGGSAGLNLAGYGIIIGEWDGGGVRTTHQEFGGRVTQKDSPSSLSSHATHVAGTMIAGGVNSDAKGMAYQANLHAYDWTDDESEIASAAASGLLVSNHSYGFVTGWDYDSRGDGKWAWYGDPGISATEAYYFGFYGENAAEWDLIAYNAPYYLPVRSAGNDRNDDGPAPGEQYWIWGNYGWELSTVTRQPDGGADGYDCIPGSAIAKNILTVGAVDDIPGGYSSPANVQMSSFSSWGPADDGRIKPDIVGNGVSLYSTDSGNNSDYVYKSGTSMSSPNVTGSLALLQEHYKNTHSGQAMRAATLKALVLHTADEAGFASGPDYAFGWGLLNTRAAAEFISHDQTDATVIQELTLNQYSSFTMTVNSDGSEALKATISWTDPPGTELPAQLNPRIPRLVNDLDLRISRNSDGQIFYPWKLNPDSPASPATRSDNVVDNTEQVFIEYPAAGSYTITVNHKGALYGGSQAFSIIVLGSASAPTPILSVSPTLLDFGSNPGVTSLSLQIQNAGDGVLNWNISKPTDKPWIASVSPEFGTNDETVIVTVDRSQLSGSSDSGILSVTSNGGNQDVTVLISAQNLPTHWSFADKTGSSATIILPLSANPNIDGTPLMDSDFVGVFTPDALCCGVSQWQSAQNLSITAWGDDDQTSAIDGFRTGEEIRYRVYRASISKEWSAVDVAYSSGNGQYSVNGFLVLSKFDAFDARTISLNLSQGWNMFSMNVVPPDLEMNVLMNPVLGSLKLVKNNAGLNFIPGYGINTIGDLNPHEGYLAYMNASATLDVTGQPIAADTPVSLSSGWSIISYFPQEALDPAVALVSLNAELKLIKDNWGRVYFPQFGINSIGQMLPGQAYFAYLNSPGILIYPASGGLNRPVNSKPAVEISRPVSPQHFKFSARTGGNAIIVIPAEIARYSDDMPLAPGDEIGIFNADELCCGAIVWDGRNAALVAWGDDVQTHAPDGLSIGETLTCRIWQKQSESEYPVELAFQAGSPETYQMNGISILQDFQVERTAAGVSNASGADMPADYRLIQNYPNPFNPETTIMYCLPHASEVKLDVFDLQGHLVKRLTKGIKPVGAHAVRWDGRDESGQRVASGMYVYRIEADPIGSTAAGLNEMKKMILLK
ncbi:S8 family serine peptidase [candidate division KSB1 bacterium]|nr:S8 family serine peptidase [candidate division KSB1 bacterium]